MRHINNQLRILFFIFFIKPLLLVLVGLNVFGRQHLPSKPFILVANHNSHLDALALMNLFPLHRIAKIRPVAAQDYFTTSPILNWFSTVLMNILPIPRKGITKTNNPLTKMSDALDQGYSLIVFPEGSRGEPEVMESFRSGVGHLIQKHPNIPVVPVYMRGMGRSLPRGELILIPFFCDIVIGKPQHFTGERPGIVQSVEAAVKKLEEEHSQMFWEHDNI
ncbi:MAG: 1-acyl-sn-glycerol-3-phosphate acyltransferase [Vampirovibrio sp.]|nr:1-acyl-sn-glycerol-3-phosphate acyltransferase [Vampirovibrio sp.]